MDNKIVVPNAIVRKSGYLYYIDGNGNLCEAQMKRGRTKKNKIENENKNIQARQE